MSSTNPLRLLLACYYGSVRLTTPGLIALTFAVGCLRIGYDAAPRGGLPVDSGMSQRDGSVHDASTADGAVRADSGAGDAAGSGDAGSGDAGDKPLDGGSSDGATIEPADGGPLPDAGMTDSGMQDAGGENFTDPARTAACPGIPGAMFCDGFEDPTFDIWSYPIRNNGTLSQSKTRVRTGSGSLRATTGSAVDHMTSGNLWARYYYYVPSSVVVNANFSTGVLAEIEDPFYGFSVLITSTGTALASGALMTGHSGAFPRDQWKCVEMHVLIADQPDGTWAFFIDGALIVRKVNIDTLPDRGFTSFDVGIHYAPSGQGPVEVYVDDVVVSTSRIGCN